MTRLLCLLLISAPFALGATALSAADEAPAVDRRAQATQAIRDYLQARVQRLNAHEPANVASIDEWQRLQPVLREQLFDMLGLSPRPERGDLQAVVTGQVERQEIIVEKLHFQSLPGLYVTGNFYRHRDAQGKLPTILYLAGHARVVEGGVSFGNKVGYQQHPLWFAQNGYGCLVIDTLQLGEIQGDHHGTYRLGQWWWIARGYTPAGVEAWNAIRALDYLETREDVDVEKIGVTGRSGGGAYTWWLAALDDRPACVVPVAGITDLEDHVVENCVEGHCDCMYHINRLGWDFATVAALAAPRPCLLTNSDKDRIFPLGGVQRIHDKLRHIYALHGAADKLGLFISEGPHADTQELQVAAFRWMNRWLRNTQHPVAAFGERYFTPSELKVFDELPGDERNTTLQESFVPLADVGPPPASLAEWDARRSALLAELQRRSFSGIASAPPLDLRIAVDHAAGSRRLRVVEYTTDEQLRLPLFVLTADGDAPIERIEITVADDETWNAWLASHAAPFVDALRAYAGGAAAEAADDQPDAALEAGTAQVVIAPRGWGPNAWLDDTKNATHLPRRFVLTGATVDEGRIWDVRRAVQALRELLGSDANVSLSGKGAAAGIALYAALFEPAVDALELTEPPASHHQGPILIGVLRVLDVPQAVALVLPRRVTLKTVDGSPWSWSESVSKLYGDAAPLRLEAYSRETE